MRKLSLLLAAAATALLPSAHAATGPSVVALPPVGAAETPLFAAGGTPLTNGIFFPGTAVCAAGSCYGQAYEVPRGNDIRFYNLDSAIVANSHRIVSKSTKKKTGAPLFQSDTVAGPGSALMKTSHLKPGVYGYFCTVHFGMEGLIEITG